MWEKWIDDWSAYLIASGRRPQTVTLRKYQIRRLARGIDMPPDAVGLDDVTHWLSAQCWKRSTLRSQHAAIQSFYKWATATQRMDRSPATLLVVPRAEAPHPHPTPDSILQRTLETTRPRERLMIRLGCEAGLRRSEVAVVHSRDVIRDSHGATLIVHGKGGKIRRVPITNDLAMTILLQASGGYLFVGNDNGHLSARWIGKLISREFPEGYSMHSLRHRFGNQAYAVDRDLAVVQDLLGHASPATTRIYVTPPDDSLRRTIEAIAKVHNTVSNGSRG